MDYREVAMTITGRVGDNFNYAVDATHHFVENVNGYHVESVSKSINGFASRRMIVMVSKGGFAHALVSMVHAYKMPGVNLAACLA